MTCGSFRCAAEIHEDTPNVESHGHGEGPDINPGLTAEQELEGMARHLGRDMGAQTAERPAGQMFQVPSGVLHLVEGAFNAFPQAVEPLLEAGRLSRALIGAQEGQDLQAPSLPVALLPVGPEEALVPEDAGPPYPVQHLLPRDPLVRRGRHQVVGRGHPRRGAEQDQFVPEVLQIATGANPVGGRGRKVAALLSRW